MAGLAALGGGGLFAGKSLAVLGAGLLSGAVAGGALVASGTVEFGGNASSGGAAGGAGLELVPCPDQGPVLGTIPRAQKVLVTARSADGGWLQLYWPAPGIERAWTKSGPLQLEGDLGSLPVAACEAPPDATPRPTVEPTPIPGATPVATPTPTPISQPTPTPVASASPTARPNAAPRVTGLAVSTATVSYDRGNYCANDPKSVTFSVSASDADGLAGVTLYFRPPGSARFLTKPMAPSGGKYVATLNTTTDGLTTAGELRYYVVAKDRNGSAKSTRQPKSGSLAMAVKVCKNTGPKFTLLTATPTSIIADPLGVGCSGTTLSELRARATDVDGVKGITLFFKKPGASSYTKRAFTFDSGTWYSYVNTVSSVDNIARSGTISWYAVGTDDKGVTTKSPLKTIKVTRCDSEASFDAPQVVSPSANQKYQYSCGTARITFGLYASDRDNPVSKALKVTFYWTLQNRRTGARTGGSMAGSQATAGQAFYTGRTTAFTGQTFYDGYATFYVVTVDQYGGKTTSPTFKSLIDLPLLGCQ